MHQCILNYKFKINSFSEALFEKTTIQTNPIARIGTDIVPRNLVQCNMYFVVINTNKIKIHKKKHNGNKTKKIGG